jgi:hypothetical protein
LRISARGNRADDMSSYRSARHLWITIENRTSSSWLSRVMSHGDSDASSSIDLLTISVEAGLADAALLAARRSMKGPC